ncbi:HNH endonuclease [Rhodococcus erythropolis]|uniref:HNH domain-containing protein n=1 Tax=Rhodococcus erythropolis (strain PR4 / NBRC 100887) TaxID=234621 RepID=C1A250_RHOE4|nr:hypothetical protein RER_39770 [Rhodococcus erythropolis PR4]
MVTTNDYVHTHRWNLLRAKIKQTRPWVCGICGLPIPRTALPRSRDSWSLDHIIPVAEGGDPYDEMNVQASHLRCNSAKCARTTTAPAKYDAPPVKVSRCW